MPNLIFSEEYYEKKLLLPVIVLLCTFKREATPSEENLHPCHIVYGLHFKGGPLLNERICLRSGPALFAQASLFKYLD